METFDMIAGERNALADLFEGFTDEQWQTASLCAAWTVRDVAAHLTVPFMVSGPSFVLGLLTNRFDFDRANDSFSRREAEKPTAEIIANLRANAEHRFTPPGMGPEAPLTDTLVHGQDIRRPLGIAHGIAVEKLVRSLDFVTAKSPKGFVPRGRLSGLALEATDADWSKGTGAAVIGPMEALLLAVTGREVALDDLTGDGVAILRTRLS